MSLRFKKSFFQLSSALQTLLVCGLSFSLVTLKRCFGKSNSNPLLRVVFVSILVKLSLTLTACGSGISAGISTIAQSSACTTTGSPYGGGGGTTASPYLICSAAQLQNVGNNLSSNFALAATIDLTNSSFTPIGSSSQPFSGTFDGANYNISNWTYNNTSTTTFVGLFSNVSGTVQNLNLVNAQITVSSSAQSTAILAGILSAGALIQNCTVSGSVTTSSGAGYKMGGIAGSATGNSQANATITNCSSSANLIGAASGYLGGLVGSSSGHLTVTHSRATGFINCGTGSGFCGGLIGAVSNDIQVSTSYYSTGTISGSGSAVGGFFGTNGGGGVVTLSNCYSTGNVQGAFSSAGGISGNSYNTISFKNVFAAGLVSGGSSNGGLVAAIAGTLTATATYWDTSTTGQISSNATGTISGTTSGYATSAMQTTATYSGWDFVNTWNPPVQGSSYPTLR